MVVELHCGSKVLEMRLVHGYPRAQIFCIFKTPGNKKKQTPMFFDNLKSIMNLPFITHRMAN